MKYILTEEEFNALSDETKAEYTLADGKAVLTLEGHEENFVEKGKWNESEKHRKNAETKTLEVEKREAQLLKDVDAAKGNKDVIAKLREDHDTEVARLKQVNEDQIKTYKADSHKSLIEAEATKFANEHFTIPSLIKGAIQGRMMVEEVDGQPVIRALKEDGSPSIQSLSEMQKDFLENKEFSGIVKATKGGGGGANPHPGGQGGGAAKQVTRTEFDAMNASARMSFSKDGGEVVDG